MATGRVSFNVSVEIDTGEYTMDEAVTLLLNSVVVLSKEVIMIEPPTDIGVSDPMFEGIGRKIPSA